MALALPEAVEAPHHGVPSFRVGGKIFATVPDAGHVNVMLDEDAIREAVLLDPASCEAVHWGDRLAAVRVSLAVVAPDALEQLLRAAWERRAPKRAQR
jgi:hypothetical protein